MAGRRGGKKQSWRARTSDPETLMLVAWGSLFAGLLALASGLASAIYTHQWASIGPIVFGGALGVMAVVSLRRRHIPETLPETKVFRPFTKLRLEDAWQRPKDTKRVVEMILSESETLPIVVGSSGIGKTTLLDVFVRKKVEDLTLPYEVISDGYRSLMTQLDRLLPTEDTGKLTVIVLDQFERWLSYVRILPFGERRDERQALRLRLQKIHERKNCTVVLSVRREWYYDLSFLEELVPAPASTCEILGPAAEEGGDTMRMQMLASFKDVLPDEETAIKVLKRLGLGGTSGRMSPLEAQIVGAVIETHAGSVREVTIDYFDKLIGGVRGAIDSYFDTVLNGAENPAVCQKVLCALSMKARFREQTELHNILAGLFEENKEVVKAVDYLDKQQLVVREGPSRCDLAHDFLAEIFNVKSGAELSPIARDSIFVYASSGGKRNTAILEDERVVEERRRLGRLVVAISVVVMAAHLILAELDVNLLGPSLARPVDGPFLDSSYILILVPYIAWIIYLGLFYDRFLINLKESAAQRALSIFLVLNLLVSVAISIVVPFAWLLAIATGGLVFGIKVMLLSRRPEMNLVGRDRLAYLASRTLWNLAFVALLGVAALYFGKVKVGSDSTITWWIYLNGVASLGLTYWCLALAPTHVTKRGSSELLGLVGRPGPVALA
jgi:hypothetical protein